MDSFVLQTMLDSIYSPNPFVQMLSGKAIAWAVCAHFIADATLNALVLRKVLNSHLPCQPKAPESNDDNNPDIAELLM